MSETALILVVDDNEDNRDLLTRRLKRQGHDVVTAANGRLAMNEMRAKAFDMVLLDIMMPEMDGYQVLESMRADSALRHLPVVVISAINELDSIVRCIKLGADDYLFKPVNTVLLNARIDSCLERKRFRDQEQTFIAQLDAERERSEQLLLNVLPKPIADRLKQEPGTIADHFDDATVLFADIVNLASGVEGANPVAAVDLLNSVFMKFDQLCHREGVEKIKTIGSAYMAVAGIPEPRPDHATAMCDLALEMQRAVVGITLIGGSPLSLRIGVSSGPVIAGVIGSSKFTYDAWGETVGTARALESYGVEGSIQVSTGTYERIGEQYMLEERGSFYVEGEGQVRTFLLIGKSQR